MAERIGIIGGGQLGRMMTPPAKELGFDVTVLDPTPNSPAAQMGAEQIVAPLTDSGATEQLARQSHYLTFEIEHIRADILKELSQLGIEINPSPETLETIKDKFVQKQFLRAAGIPTADFAAVNDAYDVRQVAGEYGFPERVSYYGGQK